MSNKGAPSPRQEWASLGVSARHIRGFALANVYAERLAVALDREFFPLRKPKAYIKKAEVGSLVLHVSKGQSGVRSCVYELHKSFPKGMWIARIKHHANKAALTLILNCDQYGLDIAMGYVLPKGVTARLWDINRPALTLAGVTESNVVAAALYTAALYRDGHMQRLTKAMYFKTFKDD